MKYYFLKGCPSPSNLQVIKTNWFEIEEKVKPLLGKPTTVTSEQQVQPQPIQSQNSVQNPRIENQANYSSSLAPPLSNELNANKEILTNELSSDLTQEEKENQLKEENERLKNERLCVICLTKDKNVLFLPCAHLAACLECSLSLKTCPICRSKIQASVRTFT